MDSWIEEEVNISTINKLLNDNFEVEISSPDGWVGVNFYIDKGLWEEYILETYDNEIVKCNCDHLFKTNYGWLSAKDMLILYNENKNIEVNTVNGFKKCKIYKTENIIPIVDINVNHENHRYYTNGIESHNTGVGKSLFMCHCAAANLTLGLNVLYITMEMAEEKIAERIDANLLNINISDLKDLNKNVYENKIKKLNGKGKLIVKEYPTSCAGSANFRHLINELKIKKKFIPDIIYIDYLNICTSSRLKQSSNINSYTYIKAIAEELRGLAVEFNVPIISATQTTRSGYSNSDIDLQDTSECIYVKEKVELIDGSIKNIEDIKPADQIISQDEMKTVMFVHHKKIKECVKIQLKSGKNIIVSKDHVFPTKKGRKSVNTGLQIGDFLNSK